MKILTSDSQVSLGTVTNISTAPGKQNVAVMNAHLKVMRLVIAATFGSLLWAGCSSHAPRQSANSISTLPGSALVVQKCSDAQSDQKPAAFAKNKTAL